MLSRMIAKVIREQARKLRALDSQGIKMRDLNAQCIAPSQTFAFHKSIRPT